MDPQEIFIKFVKNGNFHHVFTFFKFAFMGKFL